MKKILVALLSVAMMCSFFTACSSSTKKAENKEYNAEEMYSIDGNKVDVTADNVYISTISGIGFTYPDAVLNAYGTDEYPYEPYAYIYYYMPREWVDKVVAAYSDTSISDDEYYEILQNGYDAEAMPFAILRVPEDDDDAKSLKKQLYAYFDNEEEVATNVDGDVYYFYTNECPTTDDGFSEEDIAELQAIADSYEAIKNSIIVFPAVPTTIDLSSFTATDMDGNTVDQSIFADYDLTMVNCWTTWCQYCIEEMPSIETLYTGGDLPANVNIISICFDADEEEDTAKQEIQETGITFTVLKPSDDLNSLVYDQIVGFPTTFFVDSTGKMVGEVQVGAPDGDVAAAYLELINSYLG